VDTKEKQIGFILFILFCCCCCLVVIGLAVTSGGAGAQVPTGPSSSNFAQQRLGALLSKF
jgi:hypothetical protein